jgi:hypothetical protein
MELAKKLLRQAFLRLMVHNLKMKDCRTSEMA